MVDGTGEPGPPGDATCAARRRRRPARAADRTRRAGRRAAASAGRRRLARPATLSMLGEAIGPVAMTAAHPPRIMAPQRRLAVGAEPTGDGAHVRVWAPKRRSVAVVVEDAGETALAAEAG